MRKVCSILAVFLLCCQLQPARAQDYTNKGKDFWVIYTGHIDATTSRMALYITSDQNASGTLSVAGNTINFTVTANQVTTLRLTNATSPSNTVAYNAQTTGIGTNRGIHIVTDKDVVVYAHILNAARSGSTLVLPTKVLGREYFVSSYASTSGATARSQFAIVATVDNTTVEITPKLADAANTYPANVPFQVTLNKGDVFQYQSANNTDLTGSFIKSVATAGSPCKPIAVFSGSTFTSMGCAGAGSGDNLYQQLFPSSSWGQSYVTAPFILRSYDIFRILVKDPTTVVQVNGIPLSLATLINNTYYEFNTIGNNTPRIITADKPICVLQYLVTQSCDNVQSDPEMIVLTAVEQTLNDITVLSARNDLTPPNTNITRHFLNIIIKTAGIASLRIDGAPPTATAVPIPSTPYSYIQQEVTTSTLSNPSHRIVADSGFSAIAYGYGQVESYGYNAGTNVRDLYQFVTVQNQYATVPFPAACKSSPFYFSMVFPYQPTQITWDFGGLFPNITLTSPVYDSTWVVNGKQLYRYRLLNPYTINNTGTYPIRVLAQNPTQDGCSGEQEINYDLQVFNPPAADFIVTPVCFPDPVPFLDQSNTGGRPVISRFWDFGDAGTSTANNPTHAYAATGTYNVRYALITDVGCLSDTTMHPVVISPLPTAAISGTTDVCLNAASPSVTFTGTAGIAPFTFTYTLNGGSPQTISSSNGNSVSLPVPTNAAGTFTYTLVRVQDASAALCNQLQSGTATVTVRPLPTASITGSIAVCQNDSPPLITFTGAQGTAPYTFTYTIDGGSPQTVTSVSNAVTVSVPTAIPGTFTYSLVSIQEGSALACTQNQSGTAVITVNPLPTASISGNTEVCRNSTSPLVTFTGAGGTAPYTFTYSINGGPNLTVTGTGNTATVPVSTAVADTLRFTLVSVTDASSTRCSQSQTGMATVIVQPLPSPAFSWSAPHCEYGPVSFTDNSTAGVGLLNGWAWNFGDPASGAANTSVLQNPTHTYATAGTYTVSLVATNDRACSNPAFTRSVSIHPKPRAGYIIPDVCLSDTYAQFNDTSRVNSPDNMVTWQWNFGDPSSGAANTSVLQNPQHSYTAVGIYNVQLMVSSNNGCRDTITQQLSVNGSFPVANFTVANPATLCANDSVSIVEASSVFPGIITRIEIYWDLLGQPTVFDTDDVPFTGKVYRHLYPNFQAPLTRTFRIRYRAYSGGVCVNDKIQDITVNAAPKVSFNPMPDVCLDAAPFPITQASEIGGVPGTAVYSGPGVSPTGIFSPALAGPGIHTIRYKFISTTGGCADSITQTIKVLEPPVADFSVSTPRCETRSINFTQSSTTPVEVLTGWTWDFGDGSPLVNSVNGNPVTHTYATWGNYTVKLFVTTSNGCRSAVKQIGILVNPQPAPHFTYPPSLCLPNANTQFTNTTTIADGSQATLSYAWNFGDPGSGPVNTSTQINPAHVYSTTGPYTVNLQVTSAAGCVKDTNIAVTTIHDQPLASFTISKTEECIGKGLVFTDASNPMGGVVNQWNWNMGDGNTRSAASFNYIYGSPGTYTVSLFTINNFGCRSTDYTRSVTIHPYPVVDAGPDRLVLEGGQIVLQPVVSGNDLSFLWTPNQYFSGSNAVQNPIVLGVDDITYTLTVTARGGCAASDIVFVKVLKAPSIPNIFSPNGDGVNDKWIIQYLDTYPGSTVDVFNRYGQAIYHSVGYTVPWDGTVNGKPVPVGTYYYIVDPKNGRKIMSGYVDVIR